MDKKFFLHSIKVSLEAAGFSVDDLVQYYAKKKKNSSVGSSWEKFPFEVMYEGMIRSRNPLKGKKPLGVIFKNHLITLHNSPEGMNLDKATKYCKKVKIEGHVCQIGDIEFWRELLKLSEQEKQAFDQLMVRLGGEPIALSDEWFWSLAYKCKYPIGDYYYGFNPVMGDTDWWEASHLSVRPVLFLN